MFISEKLILWFWQQRISRLGDDIKPNGLIRLLNFSTVYLDMLPSLWPVIINYTAFGINPKHHRLSALEINLYEFCNLQISTCTWLQALDGFRKCWSMLKLEYMLFLFWFLRYVMLMSRIGFKNIQNSFKIYNVQAHVQALDHKFGMRPSRRHLPTVEARFDDIPIPVSRHSIWALKFKMYKISLIQWLWFL